DFGLVKVLDLGLARLSSPAPNCKTKNLTVLAGPSLMMGTPDYLAPEQAVDFHSADIRSDIYALGCTFYYLLTGQPPFPEGTLAQKLMKHQSVEPPRLDQKRKDVPPGLAAVAARMLAKRPPDRYQTPGELADALTAILAKLDTSGSTAPSVG